LIAYFLSIIYTNKSPGMGLTLIAPWPLPQAWIGSRSYQHAQYTYHYQHTRPCDSRKRRSVGDVLS